MRLDADRLADACLRVMAQRLVQLAQEPLFAELIRESAASVENRQDVDSVPIVDDLRYHIAQLYGDGELSGTFLHLLHLPSSTATAFFVPLRRSFYALRASSGV